MNKWYLSLIFIATISFGELNAQTVGVTIYEKNRALDGYTFFSPLRSRTSYLIDNCGFLINQWAREGRPGLSGYFLDNGLMMRTAKPPGQSAFPQYSEGGRVELVDWDNNLVWDILISDDERIQHHDAAYMPNGNVLILGWEKIDVNEQLELGRDPSQISEPSLWGEFVYEVEQDGLNGYNVVWEWHLKDHLIQDFDASKSNYGVVADHIGRVDINYKGPTWWSQRDWWHCNAIDYSPSRDEIVINSRNNHEVWIIDHSTTSEEAITESGGNSGKGGNLLYRWGNPEAYDSGDPSDLRMYGSHGIHFVDEGLPNAGNIMYFNNGDGRPVSNPYSTAEMITPPLNGQGQYELETNGTYGPAEPDVLYKAPEPTDFYSTYLSNVQQLPNGHIFICEGGKSGIARFFEVDGNNDIVWEYINPVGATGPVSQGNGFGNMTVFRAYKFPPSYAGFDGQTLDPISLLHLNDPMHFCTLLSDVALIDLPIDLHYSMLTGVLQIENNDAGSLEIQLIDNMGRLLNTFSFDERNGIIKLELTQSGTYYIQLVSKSGRMVKQIVSP